MKTTMIENGGLISTGNHILIDYDSFSNKERENMGFVKVRRLSQIPHEVLDINTGYGNDNQSFKINFEKEEVWIRDYNIKKILNDYNPFLMFEKISKKNSLTKEANVNG